MVKGLFEISENSSVLDELSLHFWSDLLEEWELLNNKIEIIKESLFNVFSDIIIESWLNMEWFVRFLNLFDPHVQRIKFFFNQIIKVVFCVENSVDGSHEEREEGKTDKL